MGPGEALFGREYIQFPQVYCSSLKEEETCDKDYLVVIVLVIVVAVYSFFPFPRALAGKLKGYVCVYLYIYFAGFYLEEEKVLL